MNGRRKTLKYFILTILAVAFLSGCDRRENAKAPGAEEEHVEPVLLTAYSEKSEVFMEFDPPVAGEQGAYLIHLTRLADFKPVNEGGLKLVFTPATGKAVTFALPAPTRPGIYKGDFALPDPGKYSLKLVPEGDGFADEIVIPGLEVLKKGAQPREHVKKEGEDKEEKPDGPGTRATMVQYGAGGGTISFLKEQQWEVDFLVQLPFKKDLANQVVAMGELIPASDAEATVAAPLAGIISTAKPLPFVGKRVSKGEVVAYIDPPVQQEGGVGQLSAAYAEAKGRFSLAQKEYDRAKQLHEAKIAPLKRVEEAEAALASARAAMFPLERAVNSLTGADDGGRIAVRAPLSGTVVEISVGAGRSLEAGQPILRIIDIGTLWLKANVPATETKNVGTGAGASFTVAGLEGEFKPSRLISSGDMLDPLTRTQPVLFEVPNPSQVLKVGMFANVSLRSGLVPGALVVAREALLEDEGRAFVFVHSSGETFERREVKTGVQEGGFVQITNGLAENERIVTRGAYYVKQAATAAKGGGDHGHGH